MDKIKVELYGQYRTIANAKEVVFADHEVKTLYDLLQRLLQNFPQMGRYLDLSDEKTVFSNALFLQGGAVLSSLDAEISKDAEVLLLPQATGG